MSYVDGNLIKELREKKKITQRKLADMIGVSDKAVSKWENNRGLPDVSLLEGLAEGLGVSMAELLMGRVIQNQNPSANMLKAKFYICPVCGNCIQSIGEANISCCGVNLPPQECEEAEEGHEILVEIVENEYFVHMNHPMSKEHYISFISYVTSDRIETVKLYAQQNPDCRFIRRGHGFIYMYCNRHGLVKKKL